MKHLPTSSSTISSAQHASLPLLNFRLAAAVILLLATMGVVPSLVSNAQKLEGPVTVRGVSTQGSSTGTVVSIAADGSLSKAQTWQDSEGYHVVLPNTVPVDSLKTGRGVRVRKVGDSMELLLQTKPGTRVSVEAGQNQLNFVIDGRLEGAPTSESARNRTAPTVEKAPLNQPQPSSRSQADNAAPSALTKGENTGPDSRTANEGVGDAQKGLSDKGQTASPLIGPDEIIPKNNAPVTNPAASEIQIENEDDGLLASVFSGTSVLIVMSLGLFGLLVSRKLRSKQEVSVDGAAGQSEKAELDQVDTGGPGHPANAPKGEKNISLVRAAASVVGSAGSLARVPAGGPTSLYGAYRIDQEVGKLLIGQPHRIDVLGSRAIDDRRAIEASLIKGVNSLTSEDRAQMRAREALEEYGFVARQCAAMLLAPDAFERTSAARTLGEIKSPAALPFLLEGLYDSESIVRNQAVVSIGALGLPSAIGALLDIARTHPDVPSALLSRTLSACSVEGLDFFDTITSESSLLGSGLGNIIEEITHLEPTSSVENLPESSDDPEFAQALSLLESKDVQMRAEALKTVVQFRVQSAVNAIGRVARQDVEPNLRSLAISSLGTINHESVFPEVLIGMADESREVRASAARSLSRLSFDRADAYVRVLETSDEETLRNVAKACIQAGMVSQNLDRLVSSDHRQAYETFSLICLLARANMNEPALEAIVGHPNVDVRLKVVHLLACTGNPGTLELLRQLTVREGVREEVKTALLEAMSKLEQSKPRNEDSSNESVGSDAELTLDRFNATSVESLPEWRSEVNGIQVQLDELEL